MSSQLPPPHITGDEENICLTPDYHRERYPCAIVWTPIPLITWLLPFVGHLGICDTEGVIHDFAGPYYVGCDGMAFGDPVKYWRVNHLIAPVEPDGNNKNTVRMTPSVAPKFRKYDQAIKTTTKYYQSTQSYNFFTNNCHSFAAYCLEAAEVGGPGKSWNMVVLACYLFFCGRYVSVARFLKAHFPTFIIYGLIAFFVSWSKHA